MADDDLCLTLSGIIRRNSLSATDSRALIRDVILEYDSLFAPHTWHSTQHASCGPLSKFFRESPNFEFTRVGPGRHLVAISWTSPYNVAPSGPITCHLRSDLLSSLPSGCRTPIVCDLGSSRTKIGFAGDSTPVHIFRTMCGRLKSSGIASFGGRTVMNTRERSDVFFADEADEMRGILRLRYPVVFGRAQNWREMQPFFEHAFGKDRLGVADELETRPVLLSEVSDFGDIPEEWRMRGEKLSAYEARRRTIELLFETFRVPALCLPNADALALLAHGAEKAFLDTGIVVSLGWHSTRVTPISEGVVLGDRLQRIEFGGLLVMENLVRLLGERGIDMVTSRERRYVEEEIFHKLAFVSLDPSAEPSGPKHDVLLSAAPDFRMGITLSDRFRPLEQYFCPSSGEGLAGLVREAGEALQGGQKTVLLAGAIASIPGFAERLHRELGGDFDVLPMNDPLTSTWRGGSLLAAEETAPIWITRRTYEEGGLCDGLHCRDDGSAVYERVDDDEASLLERDSAVQTFWKTRGSAEQVDKRWAFALGLLSQKARVRVSGARLFQVFVSFLVAC